MKVKVLKRAERKPPPVVCPWLIDYPYF